jgi:hypothetical protein
MARYRSSLSDPRFSVQLDGLAIDVVHSKLQHSRPSRVLFRLGTVVYFVLGDAIDATTRDGARP